ALRRKTEGPFMLRTADPCAKRLPLVPAVVQASEFCRLRFHLRAPERLRFTTCDAFRHRRGDAAGTTLCRSDFGASDAEVRDIRADCIVSRVVLARQRTHGSV